MIYSLTWEQDCVRHIGSDIPGPSLTPFAPAHCLDGLFLKIARRELPHRDVKGARCGEEGKRERERKVPQDTSHPRTKIKIRKPLPWAILADTKHRTTRNSDWKLQDVISDERRCNAEDGATI